MHLHAGEVRRGPEGRVTDDIEVGEAGEAEGLRDAAAAGGFFVIDEIEMAGRILQQLIAEEKRADERGFVLPAGEHAVGAVIWRVKRRVGLKDDVALSGDEVARAIG